MDENLQTWRKKGRHLPAELRDFHAQKDLFDLMHSRLGDQAASFPGETGINKVNGHIYVVDRFLWFMAARGYTLQKSRAKQEFVDLPQELKDFREDRLHFMVQSLKTAGPETSDSQVNADS